jgi:short subunit dehydrogenase-like uncharacterized protein
VNKKILIYGANGFTAKLILEELISVGVKPVLAGRSQIAIETLASQHALESRIFYLENQDVIVKNLKDIGVVIHCAGPFKYTALNMAEACINAGVHYTDITGEWQIFEALKLLDSKARAAGVMIMPGTGFDVVPTDCLAGKLKSQLPDATTLTLAFTNNGGGSSVGTTLTMLEGATDGGRIRENGELKVVPHAWDIRKIRFNSKDIPAVTIPWGDISTAYTHTGIPNIRVYLGATPGLISAMKKMNLMKHLLSIGFIKSIARQGIMRKRKSLEQQSMNPRAVCHLWGEVQNSKGETVEMRLDTPNGYILTARTASIIAQNILRGDFKAGYATPCMIYGNDLIVLAGGKYH